MPHKVNEPKRKAVKGWAVCFALNKKCLQGEIHSFPKRSDAKTYIKELHKEIGGFEDDHHIVPCLITFPISKRK